MVKFEINENVQHVIDFINRLHFYLGSEYVIISEGYNNIGELKTDCKIAINELFYDGFYNNDNNLRLFHLDMLK